MRRPASWHITNRPTTKFCRTRFRSTMRQVFRFGQMAVPGNVTEEIDTAESRVHLSKQLGNYCGI
ncbi:MAG: hypothetical protein U0V70_12125 [Terriglobia bacterium]